MENFRGFGDLVVDDLARVNVITGDNGVGKTALLEAFFMTVSGHSQQPFALKTWRGLDISFNPTSRDNVVDSVYADLFFKPDDPIIITADGEGFEKRKLVIEKTRGDLIVPLETGGNRKQRRADKSRIAQGPLNNATICPIMFTWTDEHGIEHKARVLISPQNVQFEGSDEKLPMCFMFAAQGSVPASQAAGLYSELRKRREAEPFRTAFLKVFDQITDISVESEGTSSVLSADVPWANRLLPLAAVSGGTNRAASVLLGITARKNGFVLVDEVEGGIFHQRHTKFAQAIINLAEEYNTQVIMTSHSEEWLESFLDCARDDDENIAFWRMERQNCSQPVLKRFTVKEFRNGMAIGEMR